MNIRKLAPGSVEFDIPPLGVIYPGEYHIFLVSDKGVPSISLRGIVSAASGGKGKVDDAKAGGNGEINLPLVAVICITFLVFLVVGRFGIEATVRAAQKRLGSARDTRGGNADEDIEQRTRLSIDTDSASVLHTIDEDEDESNMNPARHSAVQRKMAAM